MSSEEHWAQQKEWDAEGEEVEISRQRLVDNAQCEAVDCKEKAKFEVELKRVQDRSGTWFPVCQTHNDNETLYELYEKGLEQRVSN